MILGLDLGSNSVGWCLLETSTPGNPTGIVAAGVRCFRAGVDGDLDRGREESRTVKRRQARLARRNTWRRQYRKKKLFRLLQSLHLLPATPNCDPTTIHETILEIDRHLRESDPECRTHRGQQVLLYRLRARAASERVELHESGRALYHLAQRRGFLSNRKQAATAEEKDEGKVRKDIARLARELSASGQPTLGAYFATLDPDEERIRTRWTARAMYQAEFDAIWSQQASHHQHLDDDARKRVFQTIFFQRPLKDQSSLVGRCEFERSRRRSRTADPVFQSFRIRQAVSHLRIHDPAGPSRPLEPSERELLTQELERNGDLTLTRVKKLLAIPGSHRLSIEEGGEKRIPGNRTTSALRKIFGERWDALSTAEQHQVFDDLISFEDAAALRRRAERHWRLDREAAVKLSNLKIEDGYASLSCVAMQRLLPHLDRGLSYSEAVQIEYPDAFRARESYDRLPTVLSEDCFPDLRNPVVLRSLSELRKVVNGVVARYGKPDIVRIELARDLKKPRKQRREQWMRMREQEVLRKEAADRIVQEERVANPPRREIEKVLLADECGWRCPFTGQSISMNDLIGDAPAFDIEHIIPFSRSLDDSFFNKTLCLHEENRNVKKARTPFEAYGSTDRWPEILTRVRSFRGRAAGEKLRRFLMEDVGEELTDAFSTRHLNDTRYASRLAAEFVGRLYGGTVDESGRPRVQVSSGGLTSFLRARWELNKILDDGGRKNRTDHRHHAVDALVVALTTAGSVKMLADAARAADRLGGRRLFGEVDPPWDGFLDDARRAIDGIVVSHRVDRRLNGGLHEETIYGPPRVDRSRAKGQSTVRHIRKPLVGLSAREIDEVVDPNVRALVRNRFNALRASDPSLATPEKAFADPTRVPTIEARDGRRIPVRKVRIRKVVQAVPIGRGPRLRHVAPGSNHHMALVATQDADGRVTRWDAHVVTRLEAIDRWRRGVPVVQRDWGTGKKFLFSLRSGDSIRLNLPDQDGAICVVSTVSGSSIEAVRTSDARTKTEIRVAGTAGGRLRFGLDKLRQAGCEKVEINAMGELAVARD